MPGPRLAARCAPRKMPDMLHSTSTRGRPSSASGRSAKRAMRPVPSRTGAAPTRRNTIATLSPFVLIASRPHRLTCGRASPSAAGLGLGHDCV